MVPRLALRALYALKIVIDSRKSGFSDGLPLGFLSPTRGTEGVVKTTEDWWGYSFTITSNVLKISLMSYQKLAFFTYSR